jgi:hypothetical protein
MFFVNWVEQVIVLRTLVNEARAHSGLLPLNVLRPLILAEGDKSQMPQM